MAIITFISDFGLADHYVAAVKASILRVNEDLKIVDISHQVRTSDINYCAHLLTSVFRDFPLGTVHLVGISNSQTTPLKLIALELEGHFFVGKDSGVFSLISDKEPDQIVELNADQSIKNIFPLRDICGNIASKIALGTSLKELGTPINEMNRFIGTQVKLTKKRIAGNIIHIDHFGNLITNINKARFEEINQLNNDAPFEIAFKREKFNAFNLSFNEVESGHCFVLFDSQGKMIIGNREGNGAELYGLELNDQIFIDFKI